MFKLLYIFELIYLLNSVNSDLIFIIDNIYLGDRSAAGNETRLEENNITIVVNCAATYNSNYKRLKSIELNLNDNINEQIFPKFEVAYKFVKEYSGSNFLAHCLEGKSRSVSFIIFYLMKEKGWDYDTCINIILEKRPFVNPNAGFVEQLKEYYDKYINNK